MRAAAILGLGCSAKNLKPFQSDHEIEWRMGMPASAEQADVILLFGGDGTIHRHLGQLVRLELPALVVPAGSGNDFARALGLRSVCDSLMAWRKLCAGDRNVRQIDLGTITAMEHMGRVPAHGPVYFCSVAGIGLDAAVAGRANRLPRWLRGRGGYLLSLAPIIFTFVPLPMKILTPIDTDDASPLESNETARNWIARSDQPTLLAAFANTSRYGGGIKIAPRAKDDDGLLDVCIIGKVAPFRRLRLFPSVYNGSHMNIPEVKYFQAAHVRVETDRPLEVYADGEYVCRTPIEVAVQPAALKVVTL